MLKLNFLNKIDKLFLSYLGIDKEKIRPNFIELFDNNLMISSTEGFKRHLFTDDWDSFCAVHFKQINSYDKEQLGVAIGKAIAIDLIVSFEPIKIKRSL